MRHKLALLRMRLAARIAEAAMALSGRAPRQPDFEDNVIPFCPR